MKRTIKFSKLFVPCTILSGALMIFSVFGFMYRGINYGLDFQAGFIEKVRIAPTAFTLSYKGPKTVMVSLNSTGLEITATAVDKDSEAMSFPYSQYQTMGSFVDGLKDFEGLKVTLMDGVTRETKFANLFVDSQKLPRLSEVPYKVHYIPENASMVTADDIRKALNDDGLPSDAVQQVGKAEDGIFQIRLPDDGSDEADKGAVAGTGEVAIEKLEKTDETAGQVDEDTALTPIVKDVAEAGTTGEAVTLEATDAETVAESESTENKGAEMEGELTASKSDDSTKEVEEGLVTANDTEKKDSVKESVAENANTRLQAAITNALNKAFGEDNIVVLSTDFVGSRFSTSLARQAVMLVLGALCLIFLYAMVRFRWDFALGGILALLHDTLAIFAFIIWTQMEFNSISIAAVLTIIGYSINDTVVIFDRIRENISLHPKEMCTDILDISLSEVLGRTIITTVTTMLAAFALYYFTQGGMKDFAMCLIVGMCSGTYSSVYIASACINFISRKKKGEEIFVAKTNPSGGVSI